MNFTRFLVLSILVAAFAGIAAISPQQLPVVLYKVSLVSIALVLGYLADKALFYKLPSYLHINVYAGGQHVGLRILTRAIVVLATVIGVTVGL